MSTMHFYLRLSKYFSNIKDLRITTLVTLQLIISQQRKQSQFSPYSNIRMVPYQGSIVWSKNGFCPTRAYNPVMIYKTHLSLSQGYKSPRPNHEKRIQIEILGQHIQLDWTPQAYYIYYACILYYRHRHHRKKTRNLHHQQLVSKF